MGRKLTQARVDMVKKHYSGDVVDIGIGAGAFVQAMNCKGYDINARAVEDLVESGSYVDPYKTPVDAITC